MMGSGLPGRQRRLVVDSVAAVVALAVLVAPMMFVVGDARWWAGIGWSALMVSSVALRRVAPLWAVTLCTVAGVGMVLQLQAPTPAVVTVLVIVYSVARNVPGPVSLVLVPIGVAASIAGPVSWLGNVDPGERFVTGSVLVALCLALFTVAYLVGQRVRDLSRLEQLDRELAEERHSTGTQRQQQATALTMERVRSEVAHELHDVVAHSLSVIVVQAEGARALLTKRPEAAGEALNVIARTGRSSIGEMRHIVGLLRGDENASFGPTPGIADIPDMVAQAGDRISLQMPDEVPVVPDSLGLTVFRVVQESVTNFLKHAGPTAHAGVRVSAGREELAIEVTDDGVGSQSTSDGSGSGLRGMRERVNTMNGTFSSGPRPSGGYVVRATLPMPAQLGRGWLR